jgi:hypothetical protein
MWISIGYFTVVAYTAFVPSVLKHPILDREPRLAMAVWPLPVMIVILMAMHMILDFLASNAVEFGISIKR